MRRPLGFSRGASMVLDGNRKRLRIAFRVALGIVAVVPVAVIGLSLWFTEPLEDRDDLPEDVPANAAVAEPALDPPHAPALAWPGSTLDGDPAKVLLLQVLQKVDARLDRVTGYTATFRKQERVKGKLLDPQQMEMKIRHRPFAIYLKFREPDPGKEAIYAEGHHDNKVVVHNAGWSRALLPRLPLSPDHPIAMAGNRHPITDAGLANLVKRLVKFRKMDLDDADAVTILDRVKGPDGKERLRSVHTHSEQRPERPFARVEVFYEPESFLPTEIVSYDWPAKGETGPLKLAERYIYEDVKLDAALSAIDFDIKNPKYSFHRF